MKTKIHVYAYDLKEKSIKRITNNKKPLETYTVSPNGKWLIYSTSRSRSYAADAQKDPYYFLQNLETNQVTQIIKELKFPSNGFNFSKDNKGFYFVSSHASDPKWNGASISELYYFTIETNSYKKVDLDSELSDLSIDQSLQVSFNLYRLGFKLKVPSFFHHGD